MADYTITLTDAEVLAMSTVAPSAQSWIQDAATGRASAATKDILPKLIAHCNANSIQLAVGEAAQIQQALDLGVVAAAT